MNHNLSITLAKKSLNSGILTCRKVQLRERLLRWLFGPTQELMILIPGRTVQEINIAEERERDG